MIRNILALALTAALTANPMMAGTGQDAAPGQAPASRATAPAARPNVLVGMLDDVGFAQPSSFGGLV